MNNIFILIAIIFSSFSIASDHIDGVPVPMVHRQVDLSDLYIFNTPNKEDSLTIILNTYPGVGDHGHFSKKVSYDIIVNEVNQNKNTFSTVNNTKRKISCSFTEHVPGLWLFTKETPAFVTCKLSKDNQVLSSVRAEVGKVVSNKDKSIKIFTGPRSDAFFIGLEQFSSTTERKGFSSAENRSYENIMEFVNVLTIAIEIDVQLLSKQLDNSFIGVAAQSYTTYNQSKKKILDRVGRPEITNLSLHSFKKSKKIKSTYNQMNAFQTRLATTKNDFRARLIDNIGSYDKLDSTKNWQENSLNNLATVLLNDFLVISTSKNCNDDDSAFLELEKALLLNKPLSGCGGRKITDDIMNTLYSLYIGGLNSNKEDFKTGINGPYANSDKKLSSSFPYLAKPKTKLTKQAILKFLYLNQD